MNTEIGRIIVRKERFLRNEFLTMSILGALGRSNTYSRPVSETNKNNFRNALREKLSEIGRRYNSTVTEGKHLLNINELADDLTLNFSHCLKNGRFRIGIAQKSLNLYLKYLWCVGLIPEPPHCPFDSIIINRLPKSASLNWTALDNKDGYLKLVKEAKIVAQDKTLSQWELLQWGKSTQTLDEQPKREVKKESQEKSLGLVKFASRFHDKLKEVMAPNTPGSSNHLLLARVFFFICLY